MKILSIILTMVISLTIVSCYPRGDDDSIMGPGEKLVGTWIEDDTDTNALYYIFGNDGSCTHGITHCKNPDEPTQTLDFAVTRSSLNT